MCSLCFAEGLGTLARLSSCVLRRGGGHACTLVLLCAEEGGWARLHTCPLECAGGRGGALAHSSSCLLGVVVDTCSLMLACRFWNDAAASPTQYIVYAPCVLLS